MVSMLRIRPADGKAAGLTSDGFGWRRPAGRAGHCSLCSQRRGRGRACARQYARATANSTASIIASFAFPFGKCPIASIARWP